MNFCVEEFQLTSAKNEGEWILQSGNLDDDGSSNEVNADPEIIVRPYIAHCRVG